MAGNRESLRLFALLVLISLFITGCRTTVPTSVDIPRQYSSAVKATIEASGENAREIRVFLSRYASDKKMLEAAAFLIANLPLCDAASVTTTMLSEHLEYAFLARQNMPWGREVPWETFLHFVVAHRGSGEPLQNWRRQFYEELAPIVSKSGSMNEAALEVNKWCLGKSSYQYRSEWWDQGPLTSVLRGWGRCEEEMILYIAAARSVCIPARQCYAPWWQHGDGNHAWVEVWTDGLWSYLGACEPAQHLNSAWFTGPARSAAIVISTAYGEMKESTEPILRSGPGFTVINSTQTYTPSCKLDISIIDKDGKPLPDASVYVSIINHACLRPITAVKTDSKGRGSVVLGRSTVFVSAGKDGGFDSGFVSVFPDRTNSITLDLRLNRKPTGEYWMRFGTPPVPLAEDMPTAKQTKDEFQSEKGQLDGARLARLEGYKKQIATFLKISDEDKAAWEQPFSKALLDSAGNCGELFVALAKISDSQRDSLIRYITEMNFRDLLECKGSDLLSDIENARIARNRITQLGFCNYDDDIYFSFVLNNRVWRESYSSWRGELVKRFSSYVEDNLNTTVMRVNEYASLLEKKKRTPFGGEMTPIEIIRSCAVTSESERAVIAVSLLRALGIPARYLYQWGWVEFYDGSKWLPMYPADPSKLGIVTATDDATKVYAEPAKVEIKFTKAGEVLPADKCKYETSFSIAKLSPEGVFEAIWPEGDYDNNSKSYRFTLPHGEYTIFTCTRNSIGEPYIRIVPMECKTGESLTFNFALDMPEDVGLPRVRGLAALPAVAKRTLSGNTFDLSQTIKSGRKVVLVFFDTDSEPSINMMPKIAAMNLKNATTMVGICVRSTLENAKGFVDRHCPGFEVIYDAGDEMCKAFSVGTTPSVLVLSSSGSIEMWSEGHNLEIASLIERALE